MKEEDRERMVMCVCAMRGCITEKHSVVTQLFAPVVLPQRGVQPSYICRRDALWNI